MIFIVRALAYMDGQAAPLVVVLTSKSLGAMQRWQARLET
jgi:hypothetical protein